VHPRVRGGTSRQAVAAIHSGGASPRARGNRRAARERAGGAGCIPACAGEPRSGGETDARAGVHPRVRGGTTRFYPAKMDLAGASPRARGNHAIPQHLAGRLGCIPACAGEPSCACFRSLITRVHPRVRGGTWWRPTTSRSSGGASPRARGNRVAALEAELERRCIPACAGEPHLGRADPQEGRVHPRVRGGTAVRDRREKASEGASPRARGNPAQETPSMADQGCIPACAGEPGSDRAGCLAGGVHPRVRGGTPNTTWRKKRARGASPRARGNRLRRRPRHGSGGVHPRVRGGTDRPWMTALETQGASPRARGNRPRPTPSSGRRGCIPACAGEPSALQLITTRLEVHPRVRGGTLARRPAPRWTAGASPRARGNRPEALRDRVGAGCIPACAGEPPRGCSEPESSRVHPRVRGGTGRPTIGARDHQGASPRARGNPRGLGEDRRVGGCIPACAGEPQASFT